MSGNVEQLQETPQVSFEEVLETLQRNFQRVFKINELLWRVVEAGRELVAAQIAVDLLCMNVRAEQSETTNLIAMPPQHMDEGILKRYLNQWVEVTRQCDGWNKSLNKIIQQQDEVLVKVKEDPSTDEATKGKIKEREIRLNEIIGNGPGPGSSKKDAGSAHTAEAIEPGQSDVMQESRRAAAWAGGAKIVAISPPPRTINPSNTHAPRAAARMAMQA